MPQPANSGKTSASDRQPYTRLELGLLVAITLAGVLLRCLRLSHAAVEHFDEGVYASNVWFEGGYPFRHLFAPPLFMAMLEWSVRLFGTGHYGTMAVSLFFGSATIVLVWWVGRSWFGPTAGIASATLAALSEFHIAFSRTALTDPALGFWMLAAVYLTWEALRRQSFAFALPAGAATAFAWWIKYNGWLPLAIGIAGLVPWLVFHKPREVSRLKCVGIWIVIAGVAFALWSPVLYGLEDVGGYAAVEANHRGYIVGLAGWFDSLQRQYYAHRQFNGWFSFGSVALAGLFAGVLTVARFRTLDWRSVRVWVQLGIAELAYAVIVSCLVGTSVVLAALTALGIVLLLISHHRNSDSPTSTQNRQIACWLLAAWFVGLLVTTPLYRAYPRLTLPWLISTWLGAGLFISLCFSFFFKLRQQQDVVTDGPATSHWRFAIGRIVGAAILIGLLMVLPLSKQFSAPYWQDRSELESIAKVISTESHKTKEPSGGSTPQRVFLVYGEPAIVYHLAAAGELAVPVADLSVLGNNAPSSRTTTFLVTGPHAERSDSFAGEFQRVANRLEKIDSYDFTPSDLVLLDEYSARQIEDPSFDRSQTIRLYRVK